MGYHHHARVVGQVTFCVPDSSFMPALLSEVAEGEGVVLVDSDEMACTVTVDFGTIEDAMAASAAEHDVEG